MKKDIKLIDIVLILITMILIVINIICYMNMYLIPKNNNEQLVKQSTEIEENSTAEVEISEEEQILTDLKEMGERDRMQYYFSQFMGYIEDGDYLKAYELLYPEFRETYFKTLEEFKTYADKTYPEFVSFSYNNIERQGDIYVLMLTVINPNLNKEHEDAKKSQRIVIKENDFNDYVISFQVI